MGNSNGNFVSVNIKITIIIHYSISLSCLKEARTKRIQKSNPQHIDSSGGKTVTNSPQAKRIVIRKCVKKPKPKSGIILPQATDVIDSSKSETYKNSLQAKPDDLRKTFKKPRPIVSSASETEGTSQSASLTGKSPL